MKGRVASCFLPWINFSVLPVTLQMHCLFLSMVYRSHHLPIKCRNRGNVSRCCLCICLTALPDHLWEGGGGRGLHWVNPTAVREPLLLSPLSNHMVAVSSFLDVRLRDVHMSPCLLEFGLWNIKNMVSVPETFLSDTPWSSLSCIAPRGLRNHVPYATLSSLPVLKVKRIQWFCREKAEMMHVHLWDLHTYVSWFLLHPV